MESKLRVQKQRGLIYKAVQRRGLQHKTISRKCWLMEWGTSQDNFQFSTFGEWLNVRGRHEMGEEKLFGVRVLFLDILNLNDEWNIQV